MFDTDIDATLEAPVYSLTVSCHGYSHCPRAALLQLHCYSRTLLERITERVLPRPCSASYASLQVR